MLCPKCQHDNDIKNKFCSHCGSSLIEEQKIEQLKEQSRHMVLSRPSAQRQTSTSAGLISFMGWMAFLIGTGSLLFGIGMLFQPATRPTVAETLQLRPMAVAGEHIPSNLEMLMNDLTAPVVLRWSLWFIFAGLVMIALGNGLK